MAYGPKIAVLLAGCGHLDGAEIREAVLTLLALDQHGAKAQCIAPNIPQYHVINHLTHQPVPGQSRNILEEASRIARGNCLDLAKANPADYDALLMPGGYGVAKNHCDFAFKGAQGEVRPDVSAFVNAFFDAQKPVGAICISPALVALSLSKAGAHPTLTLGNDADCVAAMRQLGAQHRDTPSAREVVVDEEHRLITTPAYMFGDAKLSDVWVGVERCVAEVLKRCSVLASITQ